MLATSKSPANSEMRAASRGSSALNTSLAVLMLMGTGNYTRPAV
jgi:hypothetical protein